MKLNNKIIYAVAGGALLYFLFGKEEEAQRGITISTPLQLNSAQDQLQAPESIAGARARIYNLFTDKFGNVYRFDNYADFAKFWFSLSRKHAISIFPNFAQLQKAAANSKEARTKI